MIRTHLYAPLALILTTAACGDDTAGEATGSDSDSAEATADPTTGSESGTTEGPTGTETGTDTVATTDDSTTTDETTVEPTTFTTTDSDSDASETETGGDTDPGCPGEGGVLAFSYIWVANAAEGTISKINTQTLTEEGRYLTRPDGKGDPSRTSVNLQGDVAVANRRGGVTKFAARAADCVDRNGNFTIETSTGKDDVLAWGTDECMLWHAEFPQHNRMRPMAWTTGTFNEESCAYEGQLAWTTGSNTNQLGSIVAYALDGETGERVHEVPFPLLNVGGFGPYGGAVDGDGNFWFHSRDAGPPILTMVSADGLLSEQHVIPVIPYGITVDTQNRVWIGGTPGGIARYDPATLEWVTNEDFTGLGLQEDAHGRVWVAKASGKGAWGFDVESVQPVSEIDLAGMAQGSTRGVSIDFEGYVWVVENGTKAFRVDPETKLVEFYEGLTGAYTYSDMTGWGLSNLIPE